MQAGKKPARGKAYHHGDLRNSLIEAAAELIEENGSVDFAMIDAARRAGVSSAAPYRHFRDRDALLQEVCKLGFLGLEEAAAKAVAGREAGTEATVVALGRAYIDYVTGHPQFYDLMWGDQSARWMDSQDANLRATAFSVLSDHIEKYCKVQGIAMANPAELATKLWAMVHGLSSLALHGQLNRFVADANVYELLESSTHIFFDGLRNPKSGSRIGGHND